MHQFDETLQGKQVIVLGGSSGIGLATAQLARAQGANLTLVGRDTHKLEALSRESDVPLKTAVFDVADEEAVKTFFEQSGHIDHVVCAAGGPFYAPFAQIDFAEARRYLDSHIMSAFYVARYATPHMTTPGSLLFFSGTQSRQPAIGLSLTSVVSHGTEALTENFALELAPVRVNTIACGFVDTPLSATLLGEGLQARRDALQQTLPIRRVVQAEDVARLAVHLMLNTAITGAIYAIDGGQSLL